MDLREINIKVVQHSQKGNLCLWSYNLQYLRRLIFFQLYLMSISNFHTKYFRFCYKNYVAKTPLKNKDLYQKALQMFGCFVTWLFFFFFLLLHCAGSFCHISLSFNWGEWLISPINLKKKMWFFNEEEGRKNLNLLNTVVYSPGSSETWKLPP